MNWSLQGDHENQKETRPNRHSYDTQAAGAGSKLGMWM